LKGFWTETRGSVSVYFIIVLVPIFLFQALFVDLIRIRLASRENELALKSALRSVMSRYDRSLSDYGLYGLKWEQDASMDIFSESLSRNLSAGSSTSFPYTDTRPELGNSTLKPVYTMGNPDVLKRQITQEMKIKAPVEFLTELMDKFKKTGATLAIDEAANYYDGAEKLEKLHWKREDALDKAWGASQDMITVAETSAIRLEQDITKLQALAGRIGSQTLSEVKSAIAEAELSIKSISARMDGIRSSLAAYYFALSAMSPKDNSAGLIAAINQLSSELSNASNELASFMERKSALEQILKDMMEYTALYASSKLAASAGEAAVREAYGRIGLALDDAVEIQAQWQTELDRMRQLETDSQMLPKEIFQFEALYGADYFAYYKTEAAKIPSFFNGVMMRWDELEWWYSGQLDSVLKDVAGIKRQIQSFESYRKSEEQAREERNKAAHADEQAKRNAINSILGELRQVVGACGLAGNSYQDFYTRLEGENGLSSKYKSYNKLVSLTETAPVLPGDADRAADKSMNLIRLIGGFLTGFRDELMINEFVLDKFNNRTTGLPGNASSSVQARSLPESHQLERQEAEYILYGLSSCAANQGAAYGELFLLLFGIRTVESLMDPGTQVLQAGTPLLAFLKAAAEGAVKALADTKALTDGGQISLFQKLGAFKVTYKDILRIFFLLHPNQNSVLTRVQALLELNTGVDLTAVTTYVQGTGSSSVRMWFMPGLMKAVNRTTGLGCEITAGRCQIGQTAVYSYD
jgi:hypothetical protein